MKKLFFIAGVALSLSAAAQTEKGSWMVGANFANINFGFQDQDNLTSIGINPNLAYFMSDNLALGGELNFRFVKEKTDPDATLTYGLQPLVRYYFSKEEKSGIFGQASVGFAGFSHGNSSETGLAFSIGAGWNYFINKSVALEVGAKYINTDKKVAFASIPNGGTGLENTINLNFGVQIFLPKKSTSHVKSSYRK